MNKFKELQEKWDELDPGHQKIWMLVATCIVALFAWQAYANHEYHKAQMQRNQKNSKSAAAFSSGEVALKEEGAAGNSSVRGVSQDSFSSSSVLPLTNRNLGLEDLKADFDNTRQIVVKADDEIRRISEQNKLLQEKIVQLEQARSATSLSTSPTPSPIKANQALTPVSSTAQSQSLPRAFPQVDLKAPLPPIGELKDWDLQGLNNPGRKVSGHLGTSSEPADDQSSDGSARVDTPLPAPPAAKASIKQWRSSQEAERPAQKARPSVTIPASAVIEAVMLSGINARTSATGGTTGGSIIAANNVGSPFISRIKGAAILPNGWRVADLTDCFLSGTGIGILSTERANVTADKLTCIDPQGLIFEAKIKAYGVDLDGIQGLSGRLVTKQGSILAKEAAAGMFAGVGSAFSPQALPSYNSNATSGSPQGFVTPNANLIAGSAIGQGVNTSLGQLSKFYLDYARQMFPIVEVNAGTRVSWVVQESFDLVSLPSGNTKAVAIH